MPTRRQFLGVMGASVLGAGSIALTARLQRLEGSHSEFPSIRYGEESCSFCGMSIDDERFAAAWREGQTRERHFDDIGCMVSALNRDGIASDTRFYVHDYVVLTWVEATIATYLLSPSIKTPMAYEIAAMASHQDAHALAEQTPGMTALHWPEVMTGVERKGRDAS